MRLLVFGTSGDAVDVGVPGGTAAELLASAIAEELRTTVETRIVFAWATGDMVAYAMPILNDFQPAIVVVHVNSGFSSPAYLAFRAQRLFGGRLYRPYVALRSSLARFGLLHYNYGASGTNEPPCGPERLGAYAQAAGRRVFSAARDSLIALGTGLPWVEVDVVSRRYAELINALARRPGTALVVRGPTWRADYLQIPRARRALEERCEALERLLEAACRARAVPFYSMLRLTAHDRMRYLLPDLIHANAEGQALMAAEEARLLRPMLDAEYT